MRALWTLAAVVAAWLLVSNAQAAPPQTIDYQGYLTNAAGVPLSGSQTVVFKLYDVATGGAAVWTETQPVTVASGRFSALLGNVTTFASANLGFDVPYYLGIAVGADAEMTPRAALAMAPYAYRAIVADSATTAITATTATALSGTVSGTQITGTISSATLSGSTLAQLQGQFVTAFGAQAAQTNTITAVDTVGTVVGQYTSITIGADGLPVISYYDNTSTNLKVAKCGNAACSSGNTLIAVDTAGDVGRYTSITIGADGLPVISYYDNNSSALKVAKCGNAACSLGNTLSAVDTVGDVGHYTSIIIGADGLPVIAYYDSANFDLKVAKCGNAACSSGNTITAVDTAGTVGLYTSIAIGTDGLPVISYWDATNFVLKVAKCGNAACSSGNMLSHVDSVVSVGQHTSIAIGPDGLPVISYLDSTYFDLKVAKCGNAACSSGNTLTAVDTVGFVGQYTAITIGTDGLPIISYHDNTNGDLKVAKCSNAACSSGNTITAVDTAGIVGQYTSITIGADGLPMISYHDANNGDLKVFKCANTFCSPYFRRR